MTFRMRVFCIVSLLAALVLGMFLFTWQTSLSQESDAVVINLAGRQRMLAQRLSKDALLHALAGAKADGPAKDSLQQGIAVFENTLIALEKGGKAPITLDPRGPTVTVPPVSPEALKPLRTAHDHWDKLKEAAMAVANGQAEQHAAAMGLLSNETVSALSNAVKQLETESRRKVDILIDFQIGGAVVVLGVLGWLIFTLRNMIIAPLERLIAYNTAVAGGDLGATIQGPFIKELQVLADSTSTMVSGMRDTLARADEGQAAARDAASSAEGALSQVQEKESQLKELLGTITSVAQSAAALSSEVNHAVEDLGREIDSVDKGVHIQRDRMTETATAMEEMNATVMEVASNAGNAANNAATSRQLAADGAEGVFHAVEGIRQMQERIMGLKETMGRLGVEAENIGRIMNVISDIADQTNLLALNAAIEAARAGEAGRGFAVVADEVRKLAEKTMQATREVGAAITAIQDTTTENVQAVDTAANNIVTATDQAAEAGASMTNIVNIVEETSGQVESIAAAAEEQSAASDQINQAVTEVTAVATENSENMQRSARALTKIITLIEDLNGVIQDLSDHATSASGNGDMRAAAIKVDNRQLLTWTNDLSTGLDSIDAEHKTLVKMINELHDAMRQNKDRRIMGDILERLKDYAVTHFEHEEQHFAKHSYPDAESHIEEHHKFLAAVMDFYGEFQSGRATVTLDLMRFLKDWLQSHIKGLDTKYGPYLKARGVN